MHLVFFSASFFSSSLSTGIDKFDGALAVYSRLPLCQASSRLLFYLSGISLLYSDFGLRSIL